MFNFDDATVDSGSKYLQPGVHTVKISKIEDGSSQSGSTYLEITVEDKAGLTANHRYFLNTTAGASGKSAWDITKNALLQLVCGALDVEADVAKTKMPKAGSPAELANGLTKLLVGKPFDIRLNGKEIAGQNGKSNWIKAEFGTGKFVAKAGSNSLTFDPSKNVKMLPSTPSASTPGISTTEAPAW